MEARLFGVVAQSHQDQLDNNEQQIKTTFYNGLAEYVLGVEGVSSENINQKIKEGIIQVIERIVSTSKKANGILLPTGQIITLAKCPQKYHPLFVGLLSLKIKEVIPRAELELFADRLMSLESFHELNPKEFLQQALGLSKPPEKVYLANAAITIELIRETFYNEMASQALLAIDNNWLSREEIADEEPQIFIALPALTLLEAVQQSQQYPDAIQLLNNKLLNRANCPKEEDFPILLEKMLQLKQQWKEFNGDQLHVIKHKLACEKDLSPEHQALMANKELSVVISQMQSMATTISQSRTFQKMVMEIIALMSEEKPHPKW